MTIFLMVFFLIYGSVHLYIFRKIRGAFCLSRNLDVWLGGWSLLMIVAPVLMHSLVRLGFEGLARCTAYIGYLWMGFLFYQFLIFLVFDLYIVVVLAVGRIRRVRIPVFGFNNRVVIVMVLCSVLLVGYGFWEARSLRLERVVLSTPKLPAYIDRLKVVQVSDLHLGLMVGQERLKSVVEVIRQAKPDLLVATGDLVDGQGDNLLKLARLIRAIPTPYGKFAVLGNHEMYAGRAYSQLFLEKAGFVVLRNEFQTVAEGLVVAGVDDRRSGTLPADDHGGEAKLMVELAGEKSFVLFLKHRPQVDPASLGHFDLQLSGHLHQGQIFPFGKVVSWFYPVPVSKLIALGHGFLYVNRGAGTWGPPIRVLAPPEVTLVELVSAQSKDL